MCRGVIFSYEQVGDERYWIRDIIQDVISRKYQNNVLIFLSKYTEGLFTRYITDNKIIQDHIKRNSPVSPIQFFALDSIVFLEFMPIPITIFILILG